MSDKSVRHGSSRLVGIIYLFGILLIASQLVRGRLLQSQGAQALADNGNPGTNGERAPPAATRLPNAGFTVPNTDTSNSATRQARRWTRWYWRSRHRHKRRRWKRAVRAGPEAMRRHLPARWLPTAAMPPRMPSATGGGEALKAQRRRRGRRCGPEWERRQRGVSGVGGTAVATAISVGQRKLDRRSDRGGRGGVQYHF